MYDKAVSYNVLQRAISILNEEKSWENENRKSHIKFIRSKSCNPFVEQTQKNRNIKNEEVLKQHKQKDLIHKLENKFDKNVNIYKVLNLNKMIIFCLRIKLWSIKLNY